MQAEVPEVAEDRLVPTLSSIARLLNVFSGRFITHVDETLEDEVAHADSKQYNGDTAGSSWRHGIVDYWTFKCFDFAAGMGWIEHLDIVNRPIRHA